VNRGERKGRSPYREGVCKDPGSEPVCYCARAKSLAPSSILFPLLFSAHIPTVILFGREGQSSHYPSMIGWPPEARWGRDRIRADQLSVYDLEWSAAEEDVIPPVLEGGGIEEKIILATGEA
jgi:hypothetical protein